MTDFIAKGNSVFKSCEYKCVHRKWNNMEVQLIHNTVCITNGYIFLQAAFLCMHILYCILLFHGCTHFYQCSHFHRINR